MPSFTGGSIILAVLGFAFVIIIHELGHFLFAKWAGVKVLRFSIGFPPIVWSKRVGETEYSIGLLWLGGYVRMLGEADGEVSDDPRSFTKASAGWRAAILSGGVLFNLVSSWLILLGLAFAGLPVVKPVVGDITLEMVPEGGDRAVPSPAVRLGLLPGDEIRAVNGERTRSWEDIRTIILAHRNDPLRVVVRRDGQDLVLDGGGDVRPVRQQSAPAPQLGAEPATSRTVGAAADAFGESDVVRPGWTLERIDGQDVSGLRGQAVERLLETRIGEQISFAFRVPDGSVRHLTFRYGGQGRPLDLALGLPVRIDAPPDPGTPAAEAGLQVGDLVVALDGTPIAGVYQLMAGVQGAARAGRGVRLEVLRGEARITVEVAPRPSADGKSRLGIRLDAVDQGRIPVLPRTIAGEDNRLAAAGIAPGDVLLGIDVAAAKRGSGETAGTVPVRWLTGGTLRDVPLDLAAADAGVKAIADLVGRQVSAQGDGRLELADAKGKVMTVKLARLPEPIRPAIAGLAVGDRIVRLRQDAAKRVVLEVATGGEVRSADVRVGDGGVAFAFEAWREDYRLEEGWTEAFAMANQAAVGMVTNTLKIIPGFFQKREDGGIDATRALSGPIGIFDMLMKSSEQWGIKKYLHLVALIGLNLFLVNLLPIPIVDGGQLVVLGIETVLRRPLPDRAKAVIAYIGFGMVVSLMLFVLSLDILRKFGFFA